MERDVASKVPEITLLFWVLKIAATTLGETGGDSLSMSAGLGYLAATAVFGALFVVAVGAQISSSRFRPFLYWLTIVATTTVGTTLADFADRSLGIGYAGGASLLAVLLGLSLLTWRLVVGTVSVETVRTPKSEAFYWLTVMFSQTLGTALGDWTADSMGLGYAGGVVLFGGLIAVTWALWRTTSLSRVALFWTAFILTRPLGAVVGDLLDKPHDAGGLALSRYAASVVLALFMVATLGLLPQRAARESH